MKKIIVIFITIILILLLSIRVFNQEKRIPIENMKKVTPSTRVAAWIAWWNEENGLVSLNKAGKKITIVSPVWYRLDENSEIIEIKTAKKEEIKKIAGENEIKIIPSITNADETGFNANNVSTFLKSITSQNDQIDMLVDNAVSNGYAGWDLDWEEIKAEDKENYSQFVNKLAQALHNKNLLLSVSVHPQTGKLTDWIGSKGHDWNELGKSADYLRIMVYDFHNSKTAPGPITPTDKLKEVINYATQNVPVDKIVIGLPTYGYDWAKSGVKPVSYPEATAILTENNSKFEIDSKSFELTGTYQKDDEIHTLWFQDAESVRNKIEIAREFGVYQFVLWKLGDEDIELWNNI